MAIGITFPTAGLVYASAPSGGVRVDWTDSTPLVNNYYTIVLDDVVTGTTVYTSPTISGLARTFTGVILPTSGHAATLYVVEQSATTTTNYNAGVSVTLPTQNTALPATIASPTAGRTLAATNQQFIWYAPTHGTVTNYNVQLAGSGTTYYNATTTALNITVGSLPTNGSALTWTITTHFADGSTSVSTTNYFSSLPSSAPVVITAPAVGSTLASSSQTFAWNAPASGTVSSYHVTLVSGTTSYYNTLTTASSVAVTGIPTDGRALTLTVTTAFADGGSSVVTANYTAHTLSSAPATINSPAPGATLLGTDQTFTWIAPASGTVSNYHVTLVSGSTSYIDSITSQVSVIGNSLPADGRALTFTVVTTFTDGGRSTVTANYTSYTYSVGGFGLTSPVPNSVLPGSTVTFVWNPAPGAAYYYFYGWTGHDSARVFFSATRVDLPATSLTVSNVPTDGSSVSIEVAAYGTPSGTPYVISTYTAYTSSISITSPAAGITLAGPTATFAWTTVQGATSYTLDRGTSTNPTLYGSTSTIATTLNVTGLPTDGSTIVVTITAFVPNQTPTTSHSSYTAAGASTQPPGNVTPLSPSNGILTSVTPILSWTIPATNYIPASTTFTVKITDSTTSTTLPDINAGTSLTTQVGLTEGLVIGHTYTWGVIAANGSNRSTLVTTTFACTPSSVTTSVEFGNGTDGLEGTGATALVAQAENGVGLEQASVRVGVVIITGLRGAYPSRYIGKVPGDLYSS